MKTSFYFVLWMGIYLLIDIFGSVNMQINSFWIALATVWVINGLLKSITKKEREYIEERESAAFLDIIYRNDYRQYLNIYRRKMLFDAASMCYMGIAVVYLLIARENWLIIGVFALFFFSIMSRFGLSYKDYKSVKEADGIEYPDTEQFKDKLRLFSELRSSNTLQEMCPPPTWKDSLLRGCNFLFSILSIILGLFLVAICIPGFFFDTVSILGSAMTLAYGGLAFLYGVNDLITTSQGYNMNISY